MKNSIAHTFSHLYAETHEKPMRIHSKSLITCYSHIKDFRNICAHGERLYCSRTTRNGGVSLAHTMEEMRMVLTSKDYSRMWSGVIGLSRNTTQKISSTDVAILKRMGIKSVDDAAKSMAGEG